MARWNRLLPHWFTASVLVFVALVCIAGNVNGQQISVGEESDAVVASIINGQVAEIATDETRSMAGTSVSSDPPELSPAQALDQPETPEEMVVDHSLPEAEDQFSSVPSAESTTDEAVPMIGTVGSRAPTGLSPAQVSNLPETPEELTVDPRPSDTDDHLFEEIRTILSAIPTGREALRIMEKYEVGVRFETNRGSRFVQSSNSVVIDSAHDLVPAALLFVHEMNHVRYYHEGIAADPKTLSREEYISRKLAEEVDGDAQSIHARMELREAGVDVRQVYYPFAVEYEMYHNRAVESAKAETPAKSDQALESIGQEAGKVRVSGGYVRGLMVTSTTNETYMEFYGKWWDADNNS